MKKKILLVGGRSKARVLAQSLLKKGYQVIAINNVYDDCQWLSEVKRLEVLHGDGTQPFMLETASAAECSIAIALTPKDEDNLVICELCKKRFKVAKTVSLVADPRKTDFFYKMGIDRVVCAVSAIAGIIEQQAFVDEMSSLIPCSNRRIKIAEVTILSSAPVINKKLWEINLPKEVIIGCILRNELNMIPRGDTRIMAGDMLVLISADQEQEIAAIKALTGRDYIEA